MGGHGDDEAVGHQRLRQVRVHPGRATRAVRDDDQTPVAARGRAIRGHLEREGAALDCLRLAHGRIVDGDDSETVLGGDLGQADTGLGRAGGEREGRGREGEGGDEAGEAHRRPAAIRRCRSTSYTAIPTLVDRLSDRTRGDRIGIATSRSWYRSSSSAGSPPVSRPNTRTTPSRAARGASQTRRVALVEKKKGSPSIGISFSKASQLR